VSLIKMLAAIVVSALSFRGPAAVLPPQSYHSTSRASTQLTADAAAAVGSLIAISPAVVGTVWATKARKAQQALDMAKERFQLETMACLRGEGCVIKLEAAERSLAASKAHLDSFHSFGMRAADAPPQAVAEPAESSNDNRLRDLIEAAAMHTAMAINLILLVGLLALFTIDPMAGGTAIDPLAGGPPCGCP